MKGLSGKTEMSLCTGRVAGRWRRNVGRYVVVCVVLQTESTYIEQSKVTADVVIREQRMIFCSKTHFLNNSTTFLFLLYCKRMQVYLKVFKSTFSKILATLSSSSSSPLSRRYRAVFSTNEHNILNLIIIVITSQLYSINLNRKMVKGNCNIYLANSALLEVRYFCKLKLIFQTLPSDQIYRY